jgi:hypothetical protein
MPKIVWGKGVTVASSDYPFLLNYGTGDFGKTFGYCV